MSELSYQIVQHDGGWTYKVGDVFAETFPTHDQALAAARKAAAEQRVPTEPGEIEYQDKDGDWRVEHTDGETPDTNVRD